MYGKIGMALGAIALAVSGWTAFSSANKSINVKPQVVHAAFTDYLVRNPDTVGDSVTSYMDANPGAVSAAPSGDAIRSYLLTNPGVIVEAINVYEEQQKLAEAAADGQLVAANAEELFNDGFSIVRGNPEGDLTVVEFSDYNCGFCKRAHAEVEKFIEADGNVRLVIKEFPILGEGSVLAARAALASRAQQDGALYPAFNDALMTHRGSHTEATIMATAKEVGLDTDALRLAMLSEEVRDQINRTYSLARILKINGTPAFIIGDEVVRGFIPADRLAEFAKVARENEG